MTKSESLSNLIRDQIKPKKIREQSTLAGRAPIDAPREKTILQAIKKLSGKLEKLQNTDTNSIDETRAVDDWECYFDIREREGLFKMLIEDFGVSVIDNKDGTFTIKK